jgi:tRNA threonylcarbamoyladenosine biosynthesis protein TsaB
MADDSLILSFDTSTTCCSIAVTAGGREDPAVLGALSLCSSVTHSRRLLSSIDWLLQELSITLDDIAAIAVGLGPGSFTGLRIGMSTAKGLVYGSEKPLIGICSLDVLAASIRTEKLVCAVLDARKKEVYHCFYRCNETREARRCSQPMVSTPKALAKLIEEPVVMVGDGLSAYNELLSDKLGPLLEKAPPHLHHPAADMLGVLAAREYRNRNFLELSEAAPVYIRASDAELSLKKPGK